jgi:hypothetical protein
MNVLGMLASPAGRIARAVVGIALIVVGIFVIGGTAGWIVAAIGLVPLGAGVFDVCLVAPVFGMPFRGEDLRRRVA